MPIAVGPYTSKEEVERKCSPHGVLLRLDDDENNSTSAAELTILTEVMEEATDEVNYYLENFYDPEDLIQNLWVRHRCTTIACYLLSQHKGHPALFQARYERIIEQLNDIAEGRRQVPRLPQKSSMAPGHSNISVDYRFNQRKLRVDPLTSSGPDYPEQHVQPYPQYDYWWR